MATSSEVYITTEDGVRLFCRKIGDGPRTLVIPNGFYFLDDLKHVPQDRTIICFDLRNRGASDSITDPAKLERGVHNDVDDIEAVRRYFGADAIDLIGHSYVGVVVILYAMRYRAHAGRIVQIGSAEPYNGKQYPPHLAYTDTVIAEAFGKIGQWQKEHAGDDPVALCKKFYELLRVIYVADPANAEKIKWDRCELANERNLMMYFTGTILPSLKSLNLDPQEVAKVTSPVLTIHGRKDRSAPYGGAREWAFMLPNARLLTVENAAHAPWIESPELVLGAVKTFLDGEWPEAAEKVASI